jgi:acetaldehyde dehydrogenase/alcohol dehydrogenase
LVGLKNLDALVERIEEIKSRCHLPRTLSDAGISPEEFRANLDRLVDLAFQDPSVVSNPRRPLLSEIRTLFEECLS